MIGQMLDVQHLLEMRKIAAERLGVSDRGFQRRDGWSMALGHSPMTEEMTRTEQVKC